MIPTDDAKSVNCRIGAFANLNIVLVYGATIEGN
jgi:hypothetical protein